MEDMENISTPNGPTSADDTQHKAAFTTTLGGVMTREQGAITGDVEAWIDGDLLRIRYAGAEDVYTVDGAVAGRTLDQMVTLLTTDPGVDADGNPKTVELG